MHETESTPLQKKHFIDHVKRCSLQCKVWIIAIVVVLLFSAGLVLWIRFSILKSFSELEENSVRRSIERVERTLDALATSLEKTARDYASWDETYEFAAKPSESFVSANLSESAVGNLEIDGLLVFDQAHKLLASQISRGRVSFPDVTASQWTETFLPFLKTSAGADKDVSQGFLRTPEGPVMFSCMPILRNDSSGPSRGSLVMFRRIDDSFIHALSSLTVLDIRLRNYDPERARREAIAVRGETEKHVISPNADTLDIHLLEKDAFGQPSFVLVLALDRSIHHKAERTVMFSFVGILLFAAICGSVAVWLTRMQVISPLEKLNASVNRIGRNADTSIRLDVHGVDEISCLACEINQMLDSLAAAERGRSLAKKETEELQVQLAHAQRLEAVATLAGGLAHDFNNMLNSILGSAELLRCELPKDHPVQEHVSRIERAGANAGSLVRRLLTVSRSQSLKVEPVQLGELVLEVLRLIRAGLPKSIDFQFESHTEDDLVLADPAQLHQVIMNLATNSAHAMAGREHGVFKATLDLVHVPTAARPETLKLRDGKYVRLTLTDNGCGIAKENLPRLFEPFFSTKPQGTGSGLGLAVVHGIITKHNGSIGVRSEIGEGTSFIIHLPLNVASLQTKPLPGAPASPSSGALEQPKIRLLLVDDDRVIRETLGGGLKRLGYAVTSTSSTEEALRLACDARDKFDCILTDQMMPGTSGLELGAIIHEKHPELPMILITGFAEVIDENLASEKGFRRVLGKPLTATEINEAIRGLLHEGK
jgi:signal transduction histidine kinase/CheY-like chemotaxis protein